MAQQTKVFFHGFNYEPPKASVLDAKYLVNPKPVLIEGTGDTKVDESDKIDLVALTQTYKEECGIEFMLKQVKLGMRTLESLADDGNHSGDASVLPLDVNDAYRANLAAKQANDGIADKLGIKGDLTEESIAEAIKAIYDKAQAAKKPEGGNE